jgi:asparagine synthase (glutamine-hydrolysing)
VSLLAGVSVTADAELHNRRNLLGWLSSDGPGPDCSDADLILAAYLKWGVNCPEFLLGEFSFAVWDAGNRRLFCCRDHVGSRPFFFWTNGPRFAFASNVLSLFALSGIGRELNRGRLAWFAINGPAGGDNEGTFFQGVRSLPPATTLSFEKGRIGKRSYWKPSTCAVTVPSAPDEAFEAFREVLFEAVGCRIQNKRSIAALLSGGLDSSSLVGIAARYLEKQNRTLLALSAVVPDGAKADFIDERDFIDEFRAFRNVQIEHVAPEDGGPFDDIDNPSLFADQPLRPSRWYLYRALREAAARHNADVILDGSFGETGASSVAPGYSFELAVRFRWLTLARQLFLFQMKSGSVPRMLLRDANILLARSGRSEPLFLLAPDFRREWEPDPIREFHLPDHRLLEIAEVQRTMNHHQFRSVALARGVRLSHPFLDKRVLEFCLAAPGSLKIRDGYARYLIRGSMEGILPGRIRWRTSKCAFSPDYPRRYRAQLGKARDFVGAIRPNNPVGSVVDLDRLRYLLDNPDTPQARRLQLVIIPATIYLICFLQQFAEFRL